MMDILDKLKKMLRDRTSDQALEYGPFIDCNKRAATLAGLLGKKEYVAEDIYLFQIGLKYSRLSYSMKEDTLFDLIAYLIAYHDFKFGNPQAKGKLKN